MTVLTLGSTTVDLNGANVGSPPAGANRILIVFDSEETNGAQTLSSVTVGGQSPIAIFQKTDTTMDGWYYVLKEAQIAAMSGTAISRPSFTPGQTWITASQYFQDVDQTTPFTNTQEVGYDIDSANSTGTMTYTLDEVNGGLGVVFAADSKIDGVWGFNGGYSQLGSDMLDATVMEAVIATKSITSNASAVSTNITNSLTGDKMSVFAIMLLPVGGGGGLQDMSGVAESADITLINYYAGVIPAVNGIMTGDSAESGGPLSFKLITGASNGTLILNIDGSGTYNPDNNFVGADQFTYETWENGGAIGLATIYMIIGGLSNFSGVPNAKNIYISKYAPTNNFTNDLIGVAGTKDITITRYAALSEFTQTLNLNAQTQNVTISKYAPLNIFLTPPINNDRNYSTLAPFRRVIHIGDYKNYFVHDPQAVLDYWLVWSEWLGADTILSAQCSAPGLTALDCAVIDAQVVDDNGATQQSNKIVSLWISAAQTVAGKEYEVTVSIKTAEGREDDRSFLLYIANR